MWPKVTVAGVTALLLAALLFCNQDAVKVRYYKWQLRSAGEAMAGDNGLGHLITAVPGAGDARARYSRAKQALLDLKYLQAFELPFPAGSDWHGLVRQVRVRFPDGLWELGLDSSSSMVHITAPTSQVEARKSCISDCTVP
jgi:hypothetical protein